MRRAPVTLVELCAGSAAVSLRYLRAKAKPPIAYQGSKRAYADSILDALGLAPGGFREGDRIVLVELGPWADAYALWRTREGREHTIARLREWSGEDPRALWTRLKEAPVPTDAAERVAVWCVVQFWQFASQPVFACDGAWKRRNTGRWRTVTFNAAAAYATDYAARQRAAGKATWKRPDVRLPALVRAIEELPDLAAVEVRRADVRDALPVRRARVLFDPPYEQANGYGAMLPRADVLDVAMRWRRVGALVGVCEARPVPLAGWRAVPVGSSGWKVRTFSAQQSEYLTLSAPPQPSQLALAI